MTWVDLVAIALLAAGAIIQTRRGFAQSGFDFIAALLCLWIAKSSGEGFGKALHMGLMPGTLILFFILFGVGLTLSYFLYNTLHWTLEAYDPILGVLLGVATGWAIAHLIYWTLGEGNPVVENSALANQVLHFQAYHGFLDFMQRLGTYD